MKANLVLSGFFSRNKRISISYRIWGISISSFGIFSCFSSIS